MQGKRKIESEEDEESEDNENKLYSFTHGWPYLLSTQYGKINYRDVAISWDIMKIVYHTSHDLSTFIFKYGQLCYIGVLFSVYTLIWVSLYCLMTS